MKTKKNKILIGVIIICVIAAFIGCSLLTELVLDDAWALTQIKAGSIIATDLDDYLAVQFDASNNQATFTVGPDWSNLSSQDPTGTYSFIVDSANQQIEFSSGGELQHVVIYRFFSTYGEMNWIEWEAVDPDIQIIGDDAVIDYIQFERAE